MASKKGYQASSSSRAPLPPNMPEWMKNIIKEHEEANTVDNRIMLDALERKQRVVNEIDDMKKLMTNTKKKISLANHEANAQLQLIHNLEKKISHRVAVIEEYTRLYPNESENPNLYTMKVYHDGFLSDPPGRNYTDGKENYFERLDITNLSMQEMDKIMEALGYEDRRRIKYYFLKPGCDLDNGVVALQCDDDMNVIRECVHGGHKYIEVYTEPGVSKTLRMIQTKMKRPNKSSKGGSSASFSAWLA